MTSQKIKELYINFFKDRGHKEIPSAPLVPENDPSVLFTTAGMHPLIPYLLGENHPEGKRLVNVQRCLRTDDIDEVGDATHNTFFEMLGNWSLGDYWKKEICEWSYEFLISKKYLGINPEKLVVTVFGGDKNLSRDEETAEIWKKLGFSDNQIFYLGLKENFWGPVGEAGPCGPDTEIFFDTGKKECSKDCTPACNCGKYIELWNNVFIQYNKINQEKYEDLKQKNVDTGVGLERLAMVLQKKESVYETDMFEPIMKKLESYYVFGDFINKFPIEKRIVADHLRSAVFLAGDNVIPSNKDRGYVLRKIIRRSVATLLEIGIESDLFIQENINAVINDYSSNYAFLIENKKKITDVLYEEEVRFRNNLNKATKVAEKFLKIGTQWVWEKNKELNWKNKHYDLREVGSLAFRFMETYGIPPEISYEKWFHFLPENWFYEFYNQALEEHREQSRKGSEQKFKGGLADQSDKTIKLHTATHLLHAALRKVLGEHVEQRGSNITAERARFDFVHPEKLTPEQLKKVEDLVNEQIEKKISVVMEEMTLDDAKKSGALGIFERKYGDKVKVYTIGSPSTDSVSSPRAGSGSPFSREICGGPHAKNTGELGHYKILKEESSSKGIRRIKATLV